MGVRVREYNYSHLCEQCGGLFHSSRYEAKFCGGKCRSKYNRVQLKRSQDIERIKRDIERVLAQYTSHFAREAIAADLERFLAPYHIPTSEGRR